MYLCGVSFLTTLDIYKANFRGRHIRECKENIWKVSTSYGNQPICEIYTLKKSGGANVEIG